MTPIGVTRYVASLGESPPIKVTPAGGYMSKTAALRAAETAGYAPSRLRVWRIVTSFADVTEDDLT